MCQLHIAMRSWKLILQLNRKQPNRAKHGTRCAIGFLLSSFYNSMCISNHEVVDNILHFLAAPHRCIHSKSEFRGSNRAAKNLNFPQICPKMGVLKSKSHIAVLLFMSWTAWVCLTITLHVADNFWPQRWKWKWNENLTWTLDNMEVCLLFLPPPPRFLKRAQFFRFFSPAPSPN